MLLTIFSTICILTAIENLVIGPLIFRLNRSDLTGRYLAVSISMAIWLFGLGLTVISKNESTALLWTKFYFCGVAFIPVTYFHFCTTLADLAKEKAKIIKIGYIIAFILLIANFFNGLASSAVPKFIFKYYSNPALFHPVITAFYFIFVFYSHYLLFKTFLKVHGYERAKIAYVLGASFVALPSASCFFLHYDMVPHLVLIGIYIVWLYPLIIAYSVVTVRLMDIEIFVHRTTRALIGIVTFFVLLYVSYFTLQQFFQTYFGKFWFLLPTLIFGVGLVFLVFFIKHVFRMNEEYISQKFSYRPILKELARRTADAKTMRELLSFITRSISLYAKLDYIGVFLLSHDKEYYELVRSFARIRGRKKLPRGFRIEQKDPVVSYLKENRTTIKFSRLKFELKKTTLSFQERERLIGLQGRVEEWGVELCVPCYSEGLLLGILLLGRKINKQMFLSDDENLFLTITEQIAKPIHNFFHKKEAIEGFIRSQDVVIRAVEAKDPYTRGHSERVAELSYILGERMGLEESELQLLKYAARLHDIGKIAIRDDILNKEDRLSTKECKEVKEHPAESVKMIQPIAVQLGKNTVEGILHHHENINGTGYPDGQKEDEIHILARIIRVVDTLDALMTKRPYKRKDKISVEEIIEVFDKNKGKFFDHKATQIIIKLCRDNTFIDQIKEMIKNTGAISRI
jgi:HD-GYP domain-containing protein (c-di-GMP phosphodiesterase class II)